MDGASAIEVTSLLVNLAVATVYGKDTHWVAKQKAGTATFDGTAGWHQALQEFVDMSNAGCCQPGITAATQPTEDGRYAQGQALMAAATSNHFGTIAAAGGAVLVLLLSLPGRDGHNTGANGGLLHEQPRSERDCGATNQAAAQTFIDFIARPKRTRSSRSSPAR